MEKIKMKCIDATFCAGNIYVVAYEADGLYYLKDEKSVSGLTSGYYKHRFTPVIHAECTHPIPAEFLFKEDWIKIQDGLQLSLNHLKENRHRIIGEGQMTSQEYAKARSDLMDLIDRIDDANLV